MSDFITIIYSLRIRLYELIWAIFVIVFLANDSIALAELRDSREYTIKAGYIYNFTKFIHWPEGVKSKINDSGLTFCVVGENPFGKVLVKLEKKLKAKKLADYLIDENIQPRIPMHGFFELACVFKRKEIEGPFKLQDDTTEERPFRMEHVNIDHNFFEDYYDPSLPYIKSGDFIFLAMAKKDNAILITEDDELHKKASETGIEVYKVKPFLEEYVDASK